MLKKILEEIEEEKLKHWDPSERLDTDKLIGWCFEKCKDIIRKHMNEGKDINVTTKDKWIPVEDQDRLPKDDEYILLSFENFDLPAVGRYKANKEGGAFYLGDCDEEDTCISQDLYVNAWQPLPKPYRPKKGE